MNAKKARTFSIILLLIATVTFSMGLSKSKDATNRRVHNAEKITIELTGVSHIYNPNESPYTNGCYHVMIEYSVTNNTSVPVNYISFDSTIYNTGGGALAQFNTSYGDASVVRIEKGETETFTTELKDNMPIENNNLSLMNLYCTNIEDLSLDYNIVSARWDDGVTYTNGQQTETVQIDDFSQNFVNEDSVEDEDYDGSIDDEDYMDLYDGMYVEGQQYTVQENMKIRSNPSLSAKQLKRSDIAMEDEPNALMGDLAAIRKGSVVTCYEVSGSWMRIASGWVCCYDDESVYIK